MARAFLFVMDSVGIGGAPDAAAFGDEGADTFGHIVEACASGQAEEGRKGPLLTPKLDALGMRTASAHSTGGAASSQGCWAVGRETSNGKDTPSGHWELAGVPVGFDWGYFPLAIPAFPEELIEEIIEKADLPGVLGQKHSNGMAIIEDFGEEHLRTGAPIIYTSADSVFQIAAHEDSFGLNRLYEVCEIVRDLTYPLKIGRVIARPFIGLPGAWRRTANRRDYSIAPPEPTLCDRVEAAGGRTIGIGKIGDIFAHKGVNEVRKGPDDMALFDKAVQAMADAGHGDFVFANFVEFDSLYGHPRDVAGYARALEQFDRRLPEAIAALRPGDLLIITADHGNDPTWPGNDHTREQVPVLCVAPDLSPREIGVVGFADVGETLAAHLGLTPGAHGRSFL
ncbi:MAG: phosphopentomutase [Pseudomonadota bacterium]